MNNKDEPMFVQELLEANSNPTAKTEPIYNMDVEACAELPLENTTMKVANQVRMLVVNKLTKGGKGIPEDPKDVKVLLAAVDGMDRQAIGRLRIKTDQQLANAALEAIALADEIFGDRDALIARAKRGESINSVLGDTELPEFTPIPGQTAINPPQETFENFRTRMNMH